MKQNTTKNEKQYICPSCEHQFLEENKQLDDYLSAKEISEENAEKNAKCAVCKQKIEQICDKADVNLFLSAVKNKNLTVVVYTAPSIRTSLGEEFGLKEGENVCGKMVTAIKMLGASYCFDMNFGADLTTVEESAELLKRIKGNKNLPMLSSCCPAWVNFVERAYPMLKNNLSTCKSPQQMMGSVLTNIYAKKLNKEKTKLFVVSIVPCLAKKLEKRREDQKTEHGFDVDATITTSELAELIKNAKIDFCNLKNSEFDDDFSLSSGAGTIFGNSGGVLEAIMRSAKNSIKNEINYDLIRGKRGVREIKARIDNKDVYFACVSGLALAKPLLDDVVLGKSKYSFIEVMACDGGCVGGGGQPKSENRESAVRKRAEGLYKASLKQNFASSNENEAIINLYKKHIGKVGGKNAYKLLHVER
ncbi:MAG: iron hydrogenase small subunit [Clostridia bacterium]|nr:iron hydrogenase small subunit [Clostridia bacterium]